MTTITAVFCAFVFWVIVFVVAVFVLPAIGI